MVTSQEALDVHLGRIRDLLARLEFRHDDASKAELIRQLERERAEVVLARDVSGRPAARN
jgi:hypothetical protein